MKTLFLLLGFFGMSAMCFATDYYVSPSGSNLNDGSTGSPWQTLQYSVDQLQAGDILHVKPGTFNEKITINVSGNQDSPIVITGEFGSVMNGQGLTNQTTMISIEDKSYITVQHMTIQNNQMNDAQGISVSGHCVGITIYDNYFSDINFSTNPSDVANENTNAQPIIVLGTNPTQAISELEILFNNIVNCRLGYSEALAVNGNVTNFSIQGNFITAVTNIGIAVIGHEGTSSDPLTDQARSGSVLDNRLVNCRSPYAACAGIYVDGGKDILIERNSTHENNYGIEIGCEHPGKSAADIMVRNNMIYHNDYAGIQSGGYDFGGLSGKVERVKVYNNTLFKNDSLHDGNGDLLISYLETGDFQNNIIFSNDQAKAIVVSDTASGLTFDFNLYYNPTQDLSELFETTYGVYDLVGFQQLGYDLNSSIGDPIFGYMTGQFIDDNYFSMGFNTTSPAVDHGNPTFTDAEYGYSDFYSSIRVWDMNPVDIGASELWFESLSELAKDPMVLYPNPADETLYIKEGNYSSYLIYDLQGKAIRSGEIENAVVQIQDLENGSYFIRLNNNSQSIVNRFTKCH